MRITSGAVRVRGLYAFRMRRHAAFSSHQRFRLMGPSVAPPSLSYLCTKAHLRTLRAHEAMTNHTVSEFGPWRQWLFPTPEFGNADGSPFPLAAEMGALGAIFDRRHFLDSHYRASITKAQPRQGIPATAARSSSGLDPKALGLTRDAWATSLWRYG